MNVFVVPSWFPSKTKPAYGIFLKEQIDLLGRYKSSWNIGVSTWGQGDEEKLLWVRDHFKNLSKLRRHGEDLASKRTENNITTYYQPALSWTKKFRKGNLDEIVRCNELNFQAHVIEIGKPDLIWVQASYPGAFIGKYLLEKYQIPYAAHVRLGGFMFDYLLSELGSMKVGLLDGLKSADLLTVTSNFQRQELGELSKSAEVVYNPVDLEFFQPLGSDSKGTRLITIGRLEEEKGFDLLIDVCSRIPEVTLTIGGSGSQLQKLRRQATDLGVLDRITFAGEMNREQVRAAIQESSFYVLPSRYETFGNVLLETMACGKPIVATKCGGPQEIVSEEVGYLCKAERSDLEEKIRMMIKNRESFNSDSIRSEAEKRFSPSGWVDQIEQLFKAAIAK